MGGGEKLCRPQLPRSSFVSCIPRLGCIALRRIPRRPGSRRCADPPPPSSCRRNRRRPSRNQAGERRAGTERD